MLANDMCAANDARVSCYGMVRHAWNEPFQCTAPEQRKENP